MKPGKNFVFTLIALVVVAALYRIIPGRPFGFAPQIAMAIFAGAAIKDRKTAFALPLVSMFVSDAFYQILYVSGLSIIPGFYEGQITNYILFTLLTVVGFLIKKINVVNVVVASVVAPTIYFLVSNFMVWLSGTGGYQHPQTFNGLMMTMADGVPFYKNSIWGTLFFSCVLFGGYYLFFSRSYKTRES